MGEEWKQEPNSQSGQPNQDEIDKRIEEIKRVVVKGANEAQMRIRRVVDKAGSYWQQVQTTPTPRQPSSMEEQRIRQLASHWSSENWRVARDLGTSMDVISWGSDEIWEATLQTRWETRNMEVVTEPYTGKTASRPQPLLPVWDYELPDVVGLKVPETHTRLEGLDEVTACTVCNSTGHILCASCNGRGWMVCPDCKGRMKKRCATCRGRGYVADWLSDEKKPFFQKQAENMANTVGGKVADVFESIRQQGVPIPNPADIDPATKGRTVPCPDCVNGESDCTCVNGKRVCTACQGSKMSLCSNCGGTGKLVRHREIVRSFDLRTQTRVVGDSPIPSQQLLKANGDLVYNAEVNETLHPEAPPERVPMDVWKATVELLKTESQGTPGTDQHASSRASLQVIELVRIPYTKVQYRYADQDYVFYAYDGEGQEKFYAENYPVRWDRIERLMKAISADLLTPAQYEAPSNPSTGSYRVPVEMPSYTIVEEDEEDTPNGR